MDLVLGVLLRSYCENGHMFIQEKGAVFFFFFFLRCVLKHLEVIGYQAWDFSLKYFTKEKINYGNTGKC